MKRRLSLFSAGLLAAALFATQLNAEIFEIKNDKVRLSIDDKGNLVSLKNLADDREYAGGEGLWRIIYQDGLSLEESVESAAVPVKVAKTDGKISLEYGGEFPVKVLCRLDGDDVVFSAEIKNASKDKVLREFQFPMIQSANIKPETVLYWSHANGMSFPNVRGWLMAGFKSYMAQDNKAIERYDIYPSPLSMNYYVLDDGNCALYFASHDPEFEKTLHLLRTRKIGGRGDFKYGGIDLAMAKYPFLGAGESKNSPSEMYLVFLDNGRSDILGSEFADILKCMRCGACMNRCPVFRLVGGHAYRAVYPGPLGIVLSPLLAKDPSKYADLPKACTLCGACADVCPAKIPLPDLVLKMRDKMKKEKMKVANDINFKGWAILASSPRLWRLCMPMNKLANLFPLDIVKFGPLGRWLKSRTLPKFRGGNFRKWFSKNG